MLRKAVIGQEYYKSMDVLSKKNIEDSANFFKKALTNDTSASGLEFIPEIWSADIIRQLYERSWHRQVIPTMTLTSEKMELPRFVSKWSASYIGSQIVSTDPANQLPLQDTSSSTEQREIHLKTLSINLMVGNKFLAYNASAQVEAILKDDMVNGLIEAELTAIINGDDSTTHQDSDTHSGAATLPQKAFKGLRKLANSTVVDNSGATFSEDTVSKMLKQLGIFAQGRKDRCVLLVSTVIADQVRRNVLPIQTLEKYGSDATIFKGELPPIYGVQVIETNFIREDLNATGVYDGVTTNLTEAIMFNADQVVIGVPLNSERAMKLSKWNDDRFDRVQLIVIEDFGFQAKNPEAINIAYNVSTA